MDIILSIIGPILLAVLSSGAWLACKHPTAYKKLKLPSIIFKYGLLYAAVYLVWHFASTTTSGALLPFVDQAKITDAKKAISILTFPKEVFLIYFVLWNGLWLYAFILSYLKDFIERAEKND